MRKIFPKINISYSLIRTRTCKYQGLTNIIFSENFAYVLNGCSFNQQKTSSLVTQVNVKFPRIFLANNFWLCYYTASCFQELQYVFISQRDLRDFEFLISILSLKSSILVRCFKHCLSKQKRLCCPLIYPFSSDTFSSMRRLLRLVPYVFMISDANTNVPLFKII